MAGRMLGAALPRLSKGRWGRKYGSKLGGYVGEAIGDLAGASAVRGLTKDDAQTPRSNATLPAPGQAAELPGMPQPAQSLTNSEPSGVSPMFEMLMPAALTRLAPAGSLLKRIPALAVLNAAGQIAQTASGEGSTAQKMEGYGRAVGGLGGSLASVAAGAALGSVIPGLGTVIGGLVGWAGGALLANGGEAAGGWLGKTLATVLGAGDSPDSQQAEQRPAQPPAAQPLTGPQPVATPPEVTQHFTFTANMPVTFNNSFEDPNTLQQLEAIARRVLDDLMRQARAVQMADQPQP
jgi:phage tail tape-measure protein